MFAMVRLMITIMGSLSRFTLSDGEKKRLFIADPE